MVSDHVWIKYLPRSSLCTLRKRLRDDSNQFQVKFKIGTEGRLNEWGFHPICEQQEDDLRIVLEPPQPIGTNRFSFERHPEEDNWTDTMEEESSSETDDELIEAIDQEKEKQGLFKADKIGPLEERDSEEDNRTDTEEEKSSSVTDDELIKVIDSEEEEEELWQADKLLTGATLDCSATEDLCRGLKTLTRMRFLRKKFWG